MKALPAAPAFVTGAQLSVLRQGHANVLSMKLIVTHFAKDAMMERIDSL